MSDRPRQLIALFHSHHLSQPCHVSAYALGSPGQLRQRKRWLRPHATVLPIFYLSDVIQKLSD